MEAAGELPRLRVGPHDAAAERRAERPRHRAGQPLLRRQIRVRRAADEVYV